jgi:hypothetical protein
MHLVSWITINVRLTTVVGSPVAEKTDTIHDHCTAPQQCAPDGIFAK